MQRAALMALVFGVVAAVGCAKGLSELESGSGESGGGGGPGATGAGGSVGATTSSSTTSGTSSGTTSGAGGATTSSSTSTSGSTSSGASSSTSTSSSSSSGASSSSSSSSGAGGAGGGCPTTASNLMGCPSCGAFCDSPWNVSWSPVVDATYYIVEYTCLIPHQYQTPNTSVDLCSEVGMCNDALCANGAGAVTVQACNANCCSPKATVPPDGTPIACGGGICC